MRDNRAVLLAILLIVIIAVFGPLGVAFSWLWLLGILIAFLIVLALL